MKDYVYVLVLSEIRWKKCEGTIKPTKDRRIIGVYSSKEKAVKKIEKSRQKIDQHKKPIEFLEGRTWVYYKYENMSILFTLHPTYVDADDKEDNE